MVFDEPPAPAARVELGFDACEPVALRLLTGVQIPLARIMRMHRQEGPAPNLGARRLRNGAGTSGIGVGLCCIPNVSTIRMRCRR